MPTETETDPTLETNVLPDLPVDDTTPPSPTPKDETPPGDDATPPAGRDPELAAALKDLATSVRGSQPAAPAAPEPTQEEIAQFWRVYDPEATDKEFFRKWFRLNPDATEEEVVQVKQLFAGVQRGLMTQAVTAARNYIQLARGEIDREYGPLKEYVETAKREATAGRFYTKYPGLKDERFTKIIDATARSLDNQSFPNEQSYFKALAEGAAGSIKAILPDFDTGAEPTKTKQPGTKLKLPRGSVGGGGGAGKGAHDVLQPTGSQNDIDSLENETE